MRNDLDTLLCERYPNIFANRHKPVQDSTMGRGFECGDGWFSLINTLCERLQFWTDHNNAPQAVALQVKEKFGSLRFYARGVDAEQAGMISMAQAMSEKICEICGNPGSLRTDGWHRTRCNQHLDD